VILLAFGIGINEIKHLTWRDAFLVIKAYEKRQEDNWRIAREIIAAIYNTVSKKKYKGRDIVSLSSDKITYDVDTLVKLQERYKKLAEKWQN
jgi:glutamate 5-kinase